MPTRKQAEAIQLYAAIMEEVKVRLSAVTDSLTGQFALQNALIREFCFLQLRMICELIALACLTAHGEIEATTRLKKEWSADKIIERLSELHPLFYPNPVRYDATRTMVGVDSEFLTKKELLELVGRCGDSLHRGSLKKLLSAQEPTQPTVAFNDIAIAAHKISALLNLHLIVLVDKQTFIICTLRNKDDHGRVQVATATRVPPTAQK